MFVLAISAMAQASEDAMPQSERTAGDGSWFNNFSLQGRYARCRAEYNVSSLFDWDRVFLSGLDGLDHGFSPLVGYERLKKRGLFLYGPGLRFEYMGDYGFQFDAYLHGRIELDSGIDLPGLPVSLRPVYGMSAGVSYGQCSFWQAYEYSLKNTQAPYNNLDNNYLIGGELVHGDKESYWMPFLEVKVGFMIDVGKKSSFGLYYAATVTASHVYNVDLQDYYAELRGSLNNYYSDDPTQNKYRVDLGSPDLKATVFHGLELSFRF